MPKLEEKNIGRLIINPWEIMALAENKKCVTFHGRRIPAAIVQNWQLRFLLLQIIGKHLREYKAVKK